MSAHADVHQPESFAFSAENKKKADAIIAKYPEGRFSACLPLLDLAQRQHDNWLPVAAMKSCRSGIGPTLRREPDTVSLQPEVFYSW